MVAHAVTTTRHEAQEERYTLRLRLWRAALLTIINMIAIIREAGARPNSQSTATLDDGRLPTFLPPIFRIARIFFRRELGSFFFFPLRFKRLINRLEDWKKIGEEGCIFLWIFESRVNFYRRLDPEEDYTYDFK